MGAIPSAEGTVMVTAGSELAEHGGLAHLAQEDAPFDGGPDQPARDIVTGQTLRQVRLLGPYVWWLMDEGGCFVDGRDTERLGPRGLRPRLELEQLAQ